LARKVYKGRVVPPRPYIGHAVFDPSTIAAVKAAFCAACDSLLLVDREDPIIELVALKVIEVASTGECDPQRILDLTLLAFNESPGQKSG
jgi:hypothetical protein